MSKPLFYLAALAAAGFLLVAGLLYFSPYKIHGDLRSAGWHRASELSLPTDKFAEQRIMRHFLPNGGAVDEVQMRDGSSKVITYDQYLRLLHVFAYFKGGHEGERGPLMYEKTHDLGGHLATERHLRLDGSTVMDGHINPDNTYVRHLYFAADTAGLPAGSKLVVSAEQVFDAKWKHTSETDFRTDGTRQTLHAWGEGSDELVTTIAADGKTILSAEGTKSGNYYSVEYFPDGHTIKADVENSYKGTTIQWYRLDQAHSVSLKVTFDNSDNDTVVVYDSTGKVVMDQVWSLDFAGNPYPGPEPRALDHVDHYRADGKIDVRYDFDRTTRKVNKITYYLGDSPWFFGPHVAYKIGPDGVATDVENNDKNNHSDGFKPIADGKGKHFVVDPSITTRPKYELPKLKDSLQLYGVPPDESFDF